MKWSHFIVMLIIIIQQTCELVQNENENNSIVPRKCKKKQNKKPQSRIMHGSKASPGQFPWHVVLYNFTGGSKYLGCGGSILSAKWVITAGHFIVDKNIFQIAVGTIQLYKDAQTRNSTKAFRHPKYNNISLNYDIGLVTFDKPLVMDANVKPVALPTLTQSKNRLIDEKVTVCGFGRNSANNIPEYLQCINLRVLDNDKWNLQSSSKPIAEDAMGAVGQQGKIDGICYGDSGGGAVTKINDVPTIVGIVSFVLSPDCNLDVPSGFSRVGYSIDWISKTTGIKVLP